MKIKLSSTLPFTPVQLDSRQDTPRRAVGQLQGIDGSGRDYRLAVYEFRHGDNDEIHYLVDQAERVYLDEAGKVLAITDAAPSTGTLAWIAHEDSLSYKPYAFVVMNAMAGLVGDWDGVVYQAPSGERLRESALGATLQVVDSCVCNTRGLWAMVNMSGDQGAVQSNGTVTGDTASRQGWVPLQALAS